MSDKVFIFQDLADNQIHFVGEFEWFAYPPDPLPHVRDYQKLARAIATCLGIELWDWDFTHHCGHPKCPNQRTFDQVFLQIDAEHWLLRGKGEASPLKH